MALVLQILTKRIHLGESQKSNQSTKLLKLCSFAQLS